MARTVDRPKNEIGVSELLGAIVLMGVIAAVVGIVGVGLLSQPPPQKIPSVSVDITTVNHTIYIRHEGGDPVSRGEFAILLDGVDTASSFGLLDGPADWSRWSIGNTLWYQVPDGQSMPSSILIMYTATR